MTKLEKATKEFYNIPDFDALLPEIINYVQLLEKEIAKKPKRKIITTTLTLSPAELTIIKDLTIELTKLRQNKVGHLAIENFAPQVFQKLIQAYNNSWSVNDGKAKNDRKPIPYNVT